jgi:hypothetical protein
MRRRKILNLALLLFAIPFAGLAGPAGAANLAFVSGDLVEPDGANIGDDLRPGTVVHAGDDALVMVEYRWRSDVPSRDCVRLDIFGYGKEYRVDDAGTDGRCETTVPSDPGDLMAAGRPFLARETRYGDAKYDDSPPERVTRSSRDWQGFERWMSRAERSFRGELRSVSGRTFRVAGKSQDMTFGFDPAKLQGPSLDGLKGEEVRVDYRLSGFPPEARRVRAEGGGGARSATIASTTTMKAPARRIEPLPAPRPRPEPRPERRPEPRAPAVETWSCEIDLHQGDTGTLRLTRQGERVRGTLRIVRGSHETEVGGTWKGESIELWRTLSSISGQPFQGVATGPHEDGVVRMAGRFANRLSGVWSADCELQR